VDLQSGARGHRRFKGDLSGRKRGREQEAGGGPGICCLGGLTGLRTLKEGKGACMPGEETPEFGGGWGGGRGGGGGGVGRGGGWGVLGCGGGGVFGFFGVVVGVCVCVVVGVWFFVWSLCKSLHVGENRNLWEAPFQLQDISAARENMVDVCCKK